VWFYFIIRYSYVFKFHYVVCHSCRRNARRCCLATGESLPVVTSGFATDVSATKRLWIQNVLSLRFCRTLSIFYKMYSDGCEKQKRYCLQPWTFNECIVWHSIHRRHYSKTWAFLFQTDLQYFRPEISKCY